MPDDNDKCAHEPCTCMVSAGASYCSAYCEHTATSGTPRKEPVCECGHPDCRGEHHTTRMRRAPGTKEESP